MPMCVQFASPTYCLVSHPPSSQPPTPSMLGAYTSDNKPIFVKDAQSQYLQDMSTTFSKHAHPHRGCYILPWHIILHETTQRLAVADIATALQLANVLDSPLPPALLHGGEKRWSEWPARSPSLGMTPLGACFTTLLHVFSDATAWRTTISGVFRNATVDLDA